MTTTTILAADDIRAIIRRVGLDRLMDELIAAIHDACSAFCDTAYDVPVRSGFHYSQPVNGLVEWMPTLEKGRSATVKMVAYHPNNPTVGELPTILSSVLILDTSNGHLQGLVDGTFLTALRTGAASAVASRILARPGASTLGLIGCGAQAVTQLHALSRVFDFERVLINDTDGATESSFADRVRHLDIGAKEIVIQDPDTILTQSDILCTCTSIEIAEGPVFRSDETRTHLHINAVGSDFPGKVELPRQLLSRSLVCPDFKAQAVQEGECQQLRQDEIGPDLAKLVVDAHDYRDYRDQLTVFDSTGWALEDHVAGKMLVRYAREFGIGREIQVESVSADPKDPYGFVDEDSASAAVKIAIVE